MAVILLFTISFSLGIVALHGQMTVECDAERSCVGIDVAGSLPAAILECMGYYSCLNSTIETRDTTAVQKTIDCGGCASCYAADIGYEREESFAMAEGRCNGLYVSE